MCAAATRPELLKSARGGDILTLNGYIYHKNKQGDSQFYWECSIRKHAKDGTKSCPARLVTEVIGDGHKIVSGDPLAHSHEADPIAVEAVRLRNGIKRTAAGDSGPPSRIIQKVAAEHSVAVQHRLSYNAQRKIVKRSKPQTQPEPETIAEFVVPEQLRLALNGLPFYRGDVEVSGEKAILFATDQDLRRLALSKYWVADAIFDTVPGLFRQLFTIHGSIGPDHKHTVPAVFALMTVKTEDLYRELLAQLSETAAQSDIDLAPPVIMTDFEKAMLNAFEHEFPEAKKVGCFFHFSKNVWKKVQTSGLLPLFGSNGGRMYEAYKRLQALAFLPVGDIPRGFAAVDEGFPDELRGVLNYVEETYVLGRKKPGRKPKRTQPLYPPALWSVYQNVADGLPRTTNQVESWHSRWSKLIGAHHVKTHRIIEEMRLEQKAAEGRAGVYLAGGGDDKRKEYQQKDKRLQKVVLNYKHYEIIDYLNAIASNLHV